jgi:hypothetical protein
VVPVYTVTALGYALNMQMLAGGVLGSVIAGVSLLLLGGARGERLLCSDQWLGALMLATPQWLSLWLGSRYVQSVPWLHGTPWGVAFLLAVAAPLWLALLSALQLVPVEVPRAVVASSIAGTGAFLLVTPTQAYRVAPNQLPVALMQLLLNILIVFTWVRARSRLVRVGTLAAAGAFLLLTAIGNAALWMFYERSSWEPVDWRSVAMPLIVQAAVMAVSTYLWFWLLGRMTLAAFGMGALAGWTAYLAFAFATGDFLWWRLDAAIVIGIVAIAVALRARVSDEQLVELGLRGG